MNPITRIYWRRIKAGAYTYSSIPDAAIKAEVKDLAKVEVASNEITSELYKELIGKDYNV